MKNLLVLSYYWLPDEGTGSYRIAKFVKYLLKRGWKITVLTASQDPRNEVSLIPNLRVVRTASSAQMGQGKKVNPSIFYAADQNWRTRLKVWFRLNVIIPDAKILWYLKAVPIGLKLAKETKFNALLSTAPPPSTSLIARRIANKAGLPWLSDFRDPWTEIYYYEDFPQGQRAKKINKRMEANCLADAQAVVCVNKGFFPPQEAASPEKFHYISNGFDPDDFRPVMADAKANDKFTIRYIGSFKMNQVCKGLLNFIKHFPQELETKVRFEFIGKVDPLVEQVLEQHLPKMVERNYLGFLEHAKAVKLMQSADLLLLLIGTAARSKLVFSTKLFEYLKSCRPCLAFGHHGGAAHQIINQCKGGYFSDHESYRGALAYVQARLEDFSKGIPPQGADTQSLDRFNFENLSLELEVILKRIAHAD